MPKRIVITSAVVCRRCWAPPIPGTAYQSAGTLSG
jgi:hypothetical protein